MSIKPPAPTKDVDPTEAFLPLHKRAFGMATGLVAGLLIFLVTAIHLVRAPVPPLNLDLLAEYFSGYTVSWPGAFLGAAWGGFVGFILGWFLAFSRNVLVAMLIVVVRTRANLAQTRNFLDHI